MKIERVISKGGLLMVIILTPTLYRAGLEGWFAAVLIILTGILFLFFDSEGK